mmetsp:Transcript_10742/g.17500  ORF Transcript_10742/g.17500 Transcript_10742/m.17500 type:complete len:204 (-) Transcript_10742:191-802(-)
MNLTRVAGIDVGFSHLACVFADIDNDTFEITPVYAHMQDLRNLKCEKPKACSFEEKDRKGAHLVHHFIELLQPWFQKVDQVIIEAQPITSTHKGIEQLLHASLKQRFGARKGSSFVRLISPRSMHAYFKISQSKVERRLQVVEITSNLLHNLPAFRKAVQKDHLGDAVAYIMFYAQTILPTIILAKEVNPFTKYALAEEDIFN